MLPEQLSVRSVNVEITGIENPVAPTCWGTLACPVWFGRRGLYALQHVAHFHRWTHCCCLAFSSFASSRNGKLCTISVFSLPHSKKLDWSGRKGTLIFTALTLLSATVAAKMSCNPLSFIVNICPSQSKTLLSELEMYKRDHLPKASRTKSRCAELSLADATGRCRG